MDNYESVLHLEKLVFDDITFHRKGFQNQNELQLKFHTQVLKSESDPNISCVKVKLDVRKENEYEATIQISGYFELRAADSFTEQEKDQLLTKNAVAILMPYIRSELSLLTAQPETESVVLPPFNINKMMDDAQPVKKTEQDEQG